MNPIIFIVALVTFFSTLLGGLFIIKLRKYLPYFFAFASGSLIAVAFLDLLPESIGLANSVSFSIRYIMIAVVASFFLYSLLERIFLTHELEEEDEHGHIAGPIGAGSLVLHSLLDGVAIGSAFQINLSIGIIVALAVIFHDFTDGINTVALMLKNKHKTRNAFIFLFLDALAPVLGILLASLIIIPQNILAILLAVFAGEFIYIGASSLLPETKHHPRKIILFVLLGILLILVLTSFIRF